MTVHLLNSAVMPQSGHYQIWEIMPEVFADQVQSALSHHELRHYIGYKTTITMLEALCDISLGDINVDKTILSDGDVFLVARLKYRIAPDTKGRDRVNVRPMTPSDFAFYKGIYSVSK